MERGQKDRYTPSPRREGRRYWIPHLHEDKAGDDGETPLELRSPSRHGEGLGLWRWGGNGLARVGPRGTLRSQALESPGHASA